jgi:Zn-dependent protease
VLGLALSKHFLIDLVINLVPMILSLSVHEYAHAWTAWRLGDDTAARQGRLTLSPLSHVDVFGTLLVPAVSALMGGFSVIGWAKPVPVRPERFNRKVTMRTGMIITALAGPLSNLLLSLIAISALAAVQRFAPQWTVGARPSGVVMLLRAMVILNVGLFIFNLLPLPPLDGSRLLPRSMDGVVASVGNYSFLLLLVVINVPFLQHVLLTLPMITVLSLFDGVFGTNIVGVFR